MKNKRYFYQIIIVAVVTLAFLGTFLPGWLLVWRSREKMNMVDAVPVEYYSPANLAIARNASANLEVYQKLQLITGRWESVHGETDAYERTMESYEAVELAREQLDKLYRLGVYPEGFTTNYENWYSWEAQFDKVVDSTFHTYAAYYWDITFLKYDGSQRHRIYMLNDGTIFLAEVWNESGMETDAVSGMSELERNVLLEEWGTTIEKAKGDMENLEEYLAFTNIETSDLRQMDLAQLRTTERKYGVLQAVSDMRYLFLLYPLE